MFRGKHRAPHPLKLIDELSITSSLREEDLVNFSIENVRFHVCGNILQLVSYWRRSLLKSPKASTVFIDFEESISRDAIAPIASVELSPNPDHDVLIVDQQQKMSITNISNLIKQLPTKTFDEGEQIDVDNSHLLTYRSVNKSGYKGDTDLEERMHGRGTKYYENGDVYDGEFYKGVKHGKGTYTFHFGDIYDGDFLNDEMHGKGVYKYANGGVYEGDFKVGLSHGIGRFSFAGGDVYFGEWKMDKMHGKGTYIHTNGDSYEGEWKHSKQNGKGIMKYADGRIEESQWRLGRKLA